MKLHEQVETLRSANQAVVAQCIRLEAALLRKTSCPYPDGTTDNQVNIVTDVLPSLHDMRLVADQALYSTLRRP